MVWVNNELSFCKNSSWVETFFLRSLFQIGKFAKRIRLFWNVFWNNCCVWKKSNKELDRPCSSRPRYLTYNALLCRPALPPVPLTAIPIPPQRDCVLSFRKNSIIRSNNLQFRYLLVFTREFQRMTSSTWHPSKGLGGQYIERYNEVWRMCVRMTLQWMCDWLLVVASSQF